MILIFQFCSAPCGYYDRRTERRVEGMNKKLSVTLLETGCCTYKAAFFPPLTPDGEKMRSKKYDTEKKKKTHHSVMNLLHLKSQEIFF